MRHGADAEHEQIATIGVTLKALLHQQGETLHTLPHIRVTERDPYPRAMRDHQSAFSAVATMTGDAPDKCSAACHATGR